MYTDTILLEEVITECLWFLSMRNLIAERPNMVPAGIGNSLSEIDLGADINLTNQVSLLEDKLSQEIASGEHDEDQATGDDGDVSSPQIATSNLAETSSAASSPPPPAATSTMPTELKQKSTSSTSQHSTKCSKLEEFTTAVAAEEQTHQMELNLRHVRLESKANLAIAKQQAKIEQEKNKQKDKD